MFPLTNLVTFIKWPGKRYEKLLHENIRKTYKKTDKKRVRAINVDVKKIAKI